MSLFRNEIIATPKILGVSDGSSAATGVVGEVQTSVIAIGSAVSLTTATAKTVTSISLTAGDWDVEGQVNFTAASATTAAGSVWTAGISTTANTLPSNGLESQATVPTLTTSSFTTGIGVVMQQLTVSTTTTVYLVGEATFTAGTVSGYGSLFARRVR